ncbi:hypothetical protein V9T40_002242 [Parthenolecanium corni]|uniref:Ankyrin repeat domain-containing protein 54 n=1 Tax=Parthenolecanium corni TaxID=536013 RepID=A0AAN9Y417_9HEMI
MGDEEKKPDIKNIDACTTYSQQPWDRIGERLLGCSDHILNLSPIYEHHDFVGKIKSRISNMKRALRSSMSPIAELKFNNQVKGQELERLLCELVFRGNRKTVEDILKLGISPNCFDHHRRPPLHIAVTKGYCEMSKLLLEYGADPNIKDGLGNTSLHLAACTNDVEMALILIKGGASVHSKDVRGRSPIQLAQSKLRILRSSSSAINKNVVSKVLDLLLLYVEKTSDETHKNDEAELLSNFQKRLQITETPEQISAEVENLSKLLSEMETLAI